MRLTPVAGIFLHGPHFGDRYGIAHTLVAALEKAHIKLLALSCTISSHFADHSPARTGRGPGHPGEHLCGPGGMRPGRTYLKLA